MITSHIASLGGVPTLFVNNQPQPGLAYITYLQERHCYEDFAKADYRLYSFTCYFGDQGINVVSGISPFAPGIFSTKGQHDFTPLDEGFKAILAARPDAFIFPRVNMALPRWWEDEHPDDCNDSGYNDGPKRSCFAANAWREQSADFLRQLISYVENSPWRDHVIGYQIGGGNTEEWFSFDQKGSVGPAARALFAQRHGQDAGEHAFRQFLNDVVAEAICYLATVAKECTNRHLVVGSFYGYTLEVPFWTACHHALKKVLASPDIDFLCSPASYMNQREPGYDWPNMTVLDSLKLHGKLYFTEYDSRTHLTRPLAECRENACKPGTYDRGVWLGPASPAVSRSVIRANFARQLTHGHASWWFDMWGGWFADPDIMRDMAEFVRIAQQDLANPQRQSIAQLAVVVDENAYALTNDNALARRCCYDNRRPLGLCGTPYDIYDVADFPAIADRYRAFVFLCPHLTPAMADAIAGCRQQQQPLLVADADQPDLSTTLLRQFCRQHGLHCYCASDDVIYVNDSYIAIHANSAGTKHLLLDRSRRITPLLDNGDGHQADHLDLTLQACATRLFHLN